MFLSYKGGTLQSSITALEHIQYFSLQNLYSLAEENGFEIIKLGVSNFVEKVFPFSIYSQKGLYHHNGLIAKLRTVCPQFAEVVYGYEKTLISL